MNTILQVEQKKVVFRSYKPSTLAKDFKVMSYIFKVEYIQQVDMFTQTMHVECCVLLEKS
ncbi:hypothetical protein ACFFIX_17340 [Metabacillus herbersteinensis]|uniref:Uncharacterized protein n=1 Tax=Metabacillus herbersteinensis TaxID=283816 RepID=A0ABV6GHM4_9BACI